MSAYIRRSLFILALLCGNLHLHASNSTTVLVLSNGDRITGKEISREAGVIHFRSDLLGVIRIAEEKAKVESSTSTDLELQLAATGAPSAGFPDQDESAPVSATKDKTTPLAIGAQQPDRPRKEPEQVSLKRQLEFGLTNQSGRRDRTDVSFRANLERKTKLSELRFHGRYLYGESDDKRVTDNLNSNLRYRRDLAPAFFAQSESKYERDSIKNLDNDFTQSFGMGRNLIERSGLKLALGGGAAARYRDIPTEDAAWVYQIDAFQDLVYSINSHLKVTQDLSLQMTPSDQQEYLVKLNAALTSKLTNTLNMSMRYEFEYDRSLAPESRENQRIVTSVGYAF